MSSQNDSEGYVLPSLWNEDAGEVSAVDWTSQRRDEILQLYSRHIYGVTPEGGAAMFKVEADEVGLLGGQARRLQIKVDVTGPLGVRALSLLLYVPMTATEENPAPVFLGLNFEGNHTTTLEGGIPASHAPGTGIVAKRGAQRHRWAYQLAVSRGYAVATVHYAEIEPDVAGAAAAGVRGIFDNDEMLAQHRDPEAWGAIGAWAWGLSRILDVLREIPEIDGNGVIVFGHSRLGKAALWAAAQDQRFAAVIANASGCGGASLFRHKSGEDVAAITTRFPHWFARGFDFYQNAEADLPTDQHQLLSALAPRPVHIASARGDLWADPRGEFLATLHASPIFELFGHSGTLPAGMVRAGCDVPAEVARKVPLPLNSSRVGARLSYHIREGGHDLLVGDWVRFLEFADESRGIPRAAFGEFHD